MHPLLNPSMTTVWRDDSTLQVGLDPERALVLTSVDRRRAAFLARLDGTRSRAASVVAGELLGLSRAEASSVLDLLGGAGLLVDGAARPPLAGLSGPEAAAIQRRRRALVVVEGHEPLIGEVTRQLSGAGVGLGRTEGEHRPQLVVLCVDGPLPPEGRADSLLAADVPHLLCAAYEQVAVIGPLVLPGRSACLTCLELHRTDRDPGWPAVAAQLARPARTLTGISRQPAGDAALTVQAAAATTAAVLALVDDPARPHELAGGQVEIRRPSVLGRRRSWGRHPRCGCHWPDREAADP